MISIHKESFWPIYKELDDTFNLVWDRSYEKLVNFSQTNDIPVHNWYYYQEGFSPELVETILKTLEINEEKPIIFDPFAGSGTTLLVGKKLGMKSYGFEINPFSEFMIEAKTSNYTAKELGIVEKFKVPKYSTFEDVYAKYQLKIIKNLFDREQLEKIELLKNKIKLVKETKCRMLLNMVLLSILPSISNYRKGGNGLKRKRLIKNYDVNSEFELKKKIVCENLKHTNGIEPKIINDSCLNMSNYKIPDVDISFFSPPYANCFDPFEVYKTELWVGEFVTTYEELRKRRKTALTSSLTANVQKTVDDLHKTELLQKIIDYLSIQELWDKRIVNMLNIYFNEMYKVFQMLFNKTKKGGYCVVVVGNSAYGNLAIPTDLLLSEMATKAGFKIKTIIAARNNETSAQQHLKLGKYSEYLRESIIIMRK